MLVNDVLHRQVLDRLAQRHVGDTILFRQHPLAGQLVYDFAMPDGLLDPVLDEYVLVGCLIHIPRSCYLSEIACRY